MKIQLPELDVISCNGSWTGLILKKHLTFDEARFIAASALGVNMDLLLDDWWARSIDEEDDIKDEIDDFTNDVEGLLTGENTWDYFTNRWTQRRTYALQCFSKWFMKLIIQAYYESNFLRY